MTFDVRKVADIVSEHDHKYSMAINSCLLFQTSTDTQTRNKQSKLGKYCCNFVIVGLKTKKTISFTYFGCVFVLKNLIISEQKVHHIERTVRPPEG